MFWNAKILGEEKLWPERGAARWGTPQDVWVQIQAPEWGPVGWSMPDVDDRFEVINFVPLFGDLLLSNSVGGRPLNTSGWYNFS